MFCHLGGKESTGVFGPLAHMYNSNSTRVSVQRQYIVHTYITSLETTYVATYAVLCTVHTYKQERSYILVQRLYRETICTSSTYSGFQFFKESPQHGDKYILN
jgi:hypothetical protein